MNVPTQPVWIDRFAVSPCSNPDLRLEDVLPAYASLGFKRFEAFTSWAKSAVDPAGDPIACRDLFRAGGFTLSSFHLPPINDDGPSLDQAVAATRFAAEAGAPIVLFKADSVGRYIEAAPAYLDRIEDLNITPVVQNHFGSPISSLADYEQVLSGIADPRMRALFEVGHFHAAGVAWRDGYALLKGQVSLVHIKDQIGAQSVPFGTGEIDLPALFEALDADGYGGEYVIEMEVADPENTIAYLGHARTFVMMNQPGDMK